MKPKGGHVKVTRFLPAFAAMWAVVLPGLATAEIITLTNAIPAKFSEPAQLRRIVVRQFSGDGGPQLSSAIAAQLAQPDAGGTPHFIVTTSGEGGRASGLGIMTGTVSANNTESRFTRQESRCVEGAGFFKCRRSEMVNVECYRRTTVLNVTVQIVRASDRRIVYTLSEPFRDNVEACDGQTAAGLAETYAAFVPQLALRIVHEISPHTETYQVRLLESTEGLERDKIKPFKAAIKIAPRDFKDSCQQWRLLQPGQKSPALLFNLGVCAEQAGDFQAANSFYAQALALSPAEKRIAEAATRVRTLVDAQRTATAQITQRARTEAGEAAAERRERQERDRASAAAAASAKRQAAMAIAQANAAKAKQRADVAGKYGADAVDNILSHHVRTGMTSAQVRAALGAPAIIKNFAPGEYEWLYPGKRIVFANGRVTFVR